MLYDRETVKIFSWQKTKDYVSSPKLLQYYTDTNVLTQTVPS